jgi:hygromycin-B 4-O-kinase
VDNGDNYPLYIKTKADIVGIMHSVAAKIVEERLKTSIVSITKVDQGDQNAVFRADTPQGRYTVRMSHDGLDTYRKEEWAMAKAIEAGVPVPRVHAVGTRDGIAYILLEWIEGVTGNNYAGDMKALYLKLGNYSRRLSGISLSGYGWDFRAEPAPHFTGTWREAVEKDRAYIFSGDMLSKLDLLDEMQIRVIRDFMDEYAAWDLPSCLSHNDICLDNVIISADGTVSLIDWSNACAQPAPMFEIARVGSSISSDLLAAFIEGYGLTAGQWEDIAETVDRLKVVHALRAVVWAAQDAPGYLEDFSKTVRSLANDWPA